MPEIEIKGADQLRALAAELKGADPKIRKELVSAMRAKTKPITNEIKDVVRSAPTHSGHGAGRVARQRRAARALSRMKPMSDERARKIAEGAREKGATGTVEELASAAKAKSRARQEAKAAAGAGLRDSIANATSGSVTSSGSTGVGITWKVQAKKLPNSQRTLAKSFNSPKGWRHPVFGDREVWVAQRGTPYFDTTIKPHQRDLEDAVLEGMEKAAEKILHPEE